MFYDLELAPKVLNVPSRQGFTTQWQNSTITLHSGIEYTLYARQRRGCDLWNKTLDS